MENNDILLEVKNLSVDFRIDRKTTLHAVRDVSFSIKKGETLGILGESGCGKSVTCMSILQLNPAKTTKYPQGEILFHGEDLLKVSKKRLQQVRGGLISMIFQEPMTALNPLYSIGDQMMEALRIHNPHMEKNAAYKACLEAIEKVNIPNPERILSAYPFSLSGGMLQRIMIAIAMLTRPQLLICDEPTTALDVTIQAQVLDLMNELKKEYGTSIIFVTHDLGVISEISDRVLVMYGGKKCEEAEVDELFTNPKHPYTKGLIGSHFHAGFKGKRLPVIPGSVPSLWDMNDGCPFENRCRFSGKGCPETMPTEQAVSGSHIVACHYWTEAEKEG